MKIEKYNKNKYHIIFEKEELEKLSDFMFGIKLKFDQKWSEKYIKELKELWEELSNKLDNIVKIGF